MEDVVDHDQVDETDQFMGLDIDMSTVKKYAVPGALIAVSFMVGGVVLQGAFLGICAAASFWIMLERIKDGAPSVYNWILDHAGIADLVVTGLAAIVFGVSITGLAAAVISGLVVSVVFDYYADKVGHVEDAPDLTFKSIYSSITSLFSSRKKKKKESENEDDPSRSEYHTGDQ